MPKRTWRRGSLRRQLIAGNILALALLLAGLGLVIRYTVASFLMASVNRELERMDRFAPPPFRRHGPGPDGPGPGPDERRGDFGRGPERGPGPEPGRRPRPPRGDETLRPRHFDLQGRPLNPLDTRTLWDPRAVAVAGRGQERRARVIVNGEPFQVLSAPLIERGEIIGVGQAAYPLTDVEQALAGLDAALLTLIPLGLLGAGAAGSFLTDRVLRRVRGATRAAEQISARDFSARLPVSGNDEFSELADTFNGLLGRLEAAFQQQERLLEQQRRFTADASHELKTPLTVIKGTASMALTGKADAGARRSFQDIDRAADAMAHLVQDLLLLARSDGGQLGKKQIILPLREVLERAVSGVSHGDGSAPIEINGVDDALCVRGNETELVRLFANLLENARRYTPPQGQITLSARAEGEHVLTCVSDTGTGIAPEHLPHLGERFYRVDTSRARFDGGSGLGLSICKSIVEAQGGSLAIESVVGEGTTVRVFLPRSGEG